MIPPAPVGMYEPFVVAGRLVAISGISSERDGRLITGKVGRDITIDDARRAAARAAENLLAVLMQAVGDDALRVEQVLFVRGYVNAAEDFGEVHQVIDAASEIIIGALGDRGRHARTALGCATLPNGNAVTLDAIVFVG
jgi:enamine deaminase RidA (YjgF/YER057c/UK114 family)